MPELKHAVQHQAEQSSAARIGIYTLNTTSHVRDRGPDAVVHHTPGLPDTTAVIVTYQSRHVIDTSLQSLRDAHRAGHLECIVVDNNSDDGTPEHIERNYPWVQVVRSDTNLGFARGCNLGFSFVTTPYVLMLNPDSMLQRGALQAMVSLLQTRSKAGIVAPAIVNEAGTLQYAGTLITPRRLISAALGSAEAYPDQRLIVPATEPFRTSWVCGAAMLIRSSLFRVLGGFDERFFLYFEETDLCRRAAAHGAEIWANGKAIARHVGGASAQSTAEPLVSGCVAEHYFRSRFYYLVKHHGWCRAIVAEGFAFVIHVGRVLRKRLIKRLDCSGSNDSLIRPLFRMPCRPGAMPQLQAHADLTKE